tara:strand:+ start:783 stop:905 length:123 start_codon:yes stop_codon:yes gene_type:complete
MPGMSYGMGPKRPNKKKKTAKKAGMKMGMKRPKRKMRGGR